MVIGYNTKKKRLRERERERERESEEPQVASNAVQVAPFCVRVGALRRYV